MLYLIFLKNYNNNIIMNNDFIADDGLVYNNDENIKLNNNNKEFTERMTIIILYSIILALNFYIFGVFGSLLFKSNKGLLIGVILGLIGGIGGFLYQYYTNRKNLIIASLLNITPLIPSGMLYTTEKIFPKSMIELIYFAIHLFTPFFSPVITFISGLLKFYPVKSGYVLSIF